MGNQPLVNGEDGSFQLIRLEGGPALGLRFNLMKASFLVVKVAKGYVMCGYLNMETADKLGDCAGRVSGVANFEALLDAKINAVSMAAKERGLHEGMSAREFLNALAD